MAIDYIEVRGLDCQLLGIIDTAKSIIWHSVYYGVGDFEVYTEATPKALELLQAGRLVTRPDDVEVGIVEQVTIEYNQQDGRMIVAAGRFAKSLLERRLIYNLNGSSNTPTILRGNVETEVRRVVAENAIACPFDSRRNIPLLQLGPVAGYPQRIVDNEGYATQKQVSYQNLLAYTDSLLQEYGMAATVILDEDAGCLRYIIYAGVDHSWENTAGNDPVIFSQEYDNMSSSSYEYNTTTEQNVALVGGAGEGVERFYSLVGGTQAGLARREVFVDAASLNRDYKDDAGNDKTYSDIEYKAMLDAAGVQQLNAATITEQFGGTFDLEGSRWKYNEHFALGDIVTAEDKDIGKYINVRLRDILETQDENGYNIEANTQA